MSHAHPLQHLSIDSKKATRLFSITGLLLLAPVSLVSLLSGHTILGMNALLVMAVLATQYALYLSKSHRHDLFKLCVTIPSIILFFSLQTYLSGIVAAFWFYPCVMIIFIIASMGQAIVITTGLFLLNLPIFFSQLDMPTALRLSISLALIGVFSAVFLSIVQLQQRKILANEIKRKEYLSNSSHELRAPLSTMLAKIEAMRDGIRPVDGVQITSLSNTSKLLSKLVADLQLLSQADVKELELHKEDFSLRALIQEIIDSLAHFHAEDKVSISLDMHGPMTIYADPIRIRQVLSNVLSNCMKYSRPPQRIFIKVIEEEGFAVITIEDSSPGVDQEALPKLFERFYRERKDSVNITPGSGLGLAIAKTLVELHKGTIVAFPSPIGGLGIRIALPIEGASAA